MSPAEYDQFDAAAPEGSEKHQELRERAANTANVNDHPTPVAPVKSQATADPRVQELVDSGHANVDPALSGETAATPTAQTEVTPTGRTAEEIDALSGDDLDQAVAAAGIDASTGGSKSDGGLNAAEKRAALKAKLAA